MARKAVKTTKPKAPAPKAVLSKQDITDLAVTVVTTLQATGLVGPQTSKVEKDEKDEELQVIDDARKTIIERVAKYGPNFKTIKQGKYRKTINTDAVGMNMINKMEQDKDQWT